jgi:hypothetical protein
MTASLVPRPAFDVNQLLSPAFAKTVESPAWEPEQVALPSDIFRVDVTGYLGQFGDSLTVQLKPLSESSSGRLNVAALPLKPSQPTVAAELLRKVPAPVASRFGFTKH